MPKLKLAKLDGKAEIFHTLQGEGASTGVPAVFIRSSLCNLHCSWCDTDYTWNWEGTPWRHENDSLPGYEKYSKEQYITELDAQTAAKEILTYGCHRLIITGGEPLLQQPAWLELIQELKQVEPDFAFEVETNGSIAPNDEFFAVIDQFNVSPKLHNSGNPTAKRLNQMALDKLSSHPNAWFKFVVMEDSDLIEISEIIEHFRLPKSRVILMPEGRTRQALNSRRLWVADSCKEHGFRYGERLHIQLWGSKRGV